MKISLWCCENQPVILVKSECDFGKVGVWFWIDKFLLNIRLYHKSFYIHYLIQYLLFFYLPGVILHKLKGVMTRWYETGLPSFYDKVEWDRTASIFWQDGMRQDCIHFVTRLYETGLHSFLWQDCMRQDCIHFYDKMAWDRTASIFMRRLYETGLNPFLWQDCMRQDCIHFFWQDGKKPVLIHFFMTSHHNTGTQPFWWQASIRPVLIHFYDKPA